MIYLNFRYCILVLKNRKFIFSQYLSQIILIRIQNIPD